MEINERMVVSIATFTDIRGNTRYVANMMQGNKIFITKEQYDKIKKDLESGAASGGIVVEIVNVLPAVGDPRIIYFIPDANPKTNNLYKEYAYVNNKWELVGQANIDLSQYMKLTDIQANPTISGSEAALKSIDIKGTKYRVGIGDITSRDATEGESIPLLELGTKVIANPEIPSGTEATQLNALKIGDGYYSAGGGGSTLYRHVIRIGQTTLELQSSLNCAKFDIITSSSTQFTFSTLKTYLITHTAVDYTINGIPVSCHVSGTNYLYIGILFASDNTICIAKNGNQSSSYILLEASYKFSDLVYDMEGNLV